MAFGSFRDPPNSVFHQFLLPSQIQFSTSFSNPVFYQFSLPRVLNKKNWKKTVWQFGADTEYIYIYIYMCQYHASVVVVGRPSVVQTVVRPSSHVVRPVVSRSVCRRSSWSVVRRHYVAITSYIHVWFLFFMCSIKVSNPPIR